jgi:hypothetical protein
MCWSCADSSTEKHQSKRDKIVDVRDKVTEIKIDDDVLFSWLSVPQLIGDYLMISDSQSYDRHIHLFDKNNFRYITSTANRGEGPEAITVIGPTGVDEANRRFYVSDMGKLKIFSFELDSVLANPQYQPEVKMKLNEAKFPLWYQYVNDTLCFGLMIEPIGNSDFKPTTGKWNMLTGEIELMKYNHPGVEKRRIYVAVSMKHGLYVETYHHHDLLSFFTLDGELKYNIYGRKWNTKKTNRYTYYGQAAFCGDKIVVPYSDGEPTFIQNKSGGMESNLPTRFIVFDTEGEYIQTLETGYYIADFCYDADNNRLLMVLNDEIQFAYLPLDGLI